MASGGGILLIQRLRLDQLSGGWPVPSCALARRLQDLDCELLERGEVQFVGCQYLGTGRPEYRHTYTGVRNSYSLRILKHC